ncbi:MULTISPECIES: amidohydrolase family protein [unclassified Achromobacter]|uniref:amidohydrolase family protein n=1 Tax=unclassified Achromobacter TaxID=2626865 RepID=UPI00069D92E6|nr:MULTISPECIES: amidohydrolase family protein [unclassified Achromobacter]KOF55359.1 2-pyrone-4,6-dicarboxylate hydrolase [Achromobacter sp. DMS1]
MKRVPPPHPAPHAPAFALPPGSCDAHVHVYGPAARFPYAPERRYDPPDAPIETLQRLHRHLGVDRAVLVQATVHGTDNRAMLDAISRDPSRYRGVALAADDADSKELEALHAGGVRGLRYNFMPHLGPSADLDAVMRMAHRIAGLGWHVQLHAHAEDLASMQDFLHALPVPFVIDHMGRVMAERGLGQPALASLLRVLEHPRAWIKLSGPERLSAALSRSTPPYADVVPIARRILDVAGDRAVWGLDWPHPNVREVPDDGDLIDILPSYGDAETLRRLLVENPARLYFGP